jgi:hypothetical protein
MCWWIKVIYCKEHSNGVMCRHVPLRRKKPAQRAWLEIMSEFRTQSHDLVKQIVFSRILRFYMYYMLHHCILYTHDIQWNFSDNSPKLHFGFCFLREIHLNKGAIPLFFS